MITRFRNWLRESKQWKEDHVESWKGMTEINENNLTEFQNKCFDHLKSSLSSNNLELTEMKIKEMNGLEKETENYVYGILPRSNSQIYIYEDGAQIDGVNLEEWDFRTPQEMISQFVTIAIEVETKKKE